MFYIENKSQIKPMYIILNGFERKLPVGESMEQATVLILLGINFSSLLKSY